MPDLDFSAPHVCVSAMTIPVALIVDLGTCKLECGLIHVRLVDYVHLQYRLFLEGLGMPCCRILQFDDTSIVRRWVMRFLLRDADIFFFLVVRQSYRRN